MRLLASVLAVAIALVGDNSFALEFRIEQSGLPQTIYDWSRQKCEEEFIPDAPARAFRRADGKLMIIATHRANWSMIGADFSSLKPVCRSILPSKEQSARTGELWIEGTYTRDGVNVAALVSQDLRPVMSKDGCQTEGLPGRCWVNNIISAQSNNMGDDFKVPSEAERVVATLGHSYPLNLKLRFGVFTTSNIVEKDGEFYMFSLAEGEGVQKSGNCLFKSPDAMKPDLWRAWDGNSFSIDMRTDTSIRPCSTIPGLVDVVRSVSFVSKFKKWVAITATNYKTLGDSEALSGFYYAVSDDLMKWGAPQRIIVAPLRPRVMNMTHTWAYPSLIDPGSLSRNFDTIDTDYPILIFSHINLDRGNGTMDRDLMYLPLRIEATRHSR